MERLKDTMNNINLLPLEIFGRILAHLPQKKVVHNRLVCKHWRNVIDEHCSMKVVFSSNDTFLYRKLELRIKECEILGLPDDSINIKFAYPQSIRSIKFSPVINLKTVRCLLNQVKPYVHILELEAKYFKENIFTQPFVFPQLRELRIKQNWIRDSRSVNLDILFSHRMPLLKALCINFDQTELHMVDETYKGFFNFLAIHRLSIKHLVVNIQKNNEHKLDMSEAFKLPNEVKRYLYDGQLQIENFHLTLPPRYISAWAPVLKSQKNLINLTHWGVGALGIPSNAFRPGIESSIATLRKLCLRDILSVGYDGKTWIPFDCNVLGKAVNLTELMLCRNTSRTEDDATPKPKENEGAPIINLGEIPLTCLKVLQIHSFVCDSGELQTLVDNAPLLETLILWRTQAPANNSRFGGTGVHGGIIHSFMKKPNKKRIHVISINRFNQEQNDKLDAVRRSFRLIESYSK